jgi:hypothetical protein
MSYYFSIFGGYTYSVNEKEEKVLDSFQIPLKSKPSNSCNKCYGKFHVGYDSNKRHFIACPKCMKKYLDVTKILSSRNGKK